MNIILFASSVKNILHTWLPARTDKPNPLQSSTSWSSIGMRGTTIIVMEPAQNIVKCKGI